jgi:hypothetical protein
MGRKGGAEQLVTCRFVAQVMKALMGSLKG